MKKKKTSQKGSNIDKHKNYNNFDRYVACSKSY